MKNESMMKSFEESKNVRKEKGKNGQAKNLHTKDHYVYINCYDLRSRPLKQKPTNVGQIAIERQAGQINTEGALA